MKKLLPPAFFCHSHIAVQLWRKLILLTVAALVSNGLRAQTAVWTGATDGQWDTPSNWSTNAVPDANTDVQIPTSTANVPSFNGPLATPIVVRNFSLAAGASVNMNSRTLSIKGDARFDGMLNSNTGGVSFSGTGIQQLYGTNTVIFHKLMISQTTASSAVVLTQTVVIDNGGTLVLNQGKIVSSNDYPVVFNQDAIATGASDGSFVSGPVEKQMDGKEFIFPVGKGCTYHAIGVTPAENNRNVYRAEYLPSGYNPNQYLEPLQHVSTIEHWELLAVSNSGSRAINDLSLYWADQGLIQCNTALANIRVAQWNGSNWRSRGGYSQPLLAPTHVHSAEVINLENSINYFSLASEASLLGPICLRTAPPPTLALNFVSDDADNTICQGTTVTFTAQSAQATNFEFFVNQTSVQNGQENTYVAQALPPGSPNVTVIASNGSTCDTAGTLTMKVHALPAKPVISGTAYFCAGQITTLSSDALLGNQWYFDGQPIDGATEQTLTVTAVGDYFVSVSTTDCAAASDRVTVTEKAVSEPIITGQLSFCKGSSTTLTSSVASGNQWYHEGELLDKETNPTLVVLQPGRYSLVVLTEAEACSNGTAAVDITENQPLEAPTIDGPRFFCTNGSTTLVSSAPEGNQWYRDGIPIDQAVDQQLQVTQTGRYAVSVTDINGCSALSAAVRVTEVPLPQTPVISGDNVFCANASTTLRSTAIEGNQWYLDEKPIAGSTNPTLLVRKAGSYRVTVTNANGCSASSSSYTVNTLPVPVLTINGLNSEYCPSAAQVTLTGTPAGGTFSGDGIAGNLFSPSLAVPGLNTVTYTYTAPNGCTSTVSVTVKVAPPTVSAGADTAVCANAAPFQLTSGSPAGGVWSGNGVDANGMFTPAASRIGSQVLVYTANVCGTPRAAQKTIEVLSIPKAEFTSAPLAGVVGEPLTFILSDATNRSNRYAWDFGDNATSNQANPTHTYDQPGEYPVSLTITNASDCRDTYRTKVMVGHHKIYVPNMFSPLAQREENRSLRVFGSGFTTQGFEFRVYDRWGVLVYETTDFQAANAGGWDGTERQSGRPQQAGVYTYTLKGTLEDGKAFRQSGNVTLVR